MSDTAQDLLHLNQRLLEAIVAGDWRTYDGLCDPSITCFEPEARGQLVVGMPFHRHYFPDQPPQGGPTKTVTMSQPHVRLLGSDAAILCYVRLTQSVGGDGKHQTTRFEETRVWQRIGGQWKHVHFHRSRNR